jgi:hypothetical protein
MRGSTTEDKCLQQSVDSGKLRGQSTSLRTTASSSISSRTRKLSTLSTSLLFARQRSSDSSVLSSLQGDGCHSAMGEVPVGDVPTIYPDTINPEFQASGSAGLSAPVKSPLAMPVVHCEAHHVESPLFADLVSDYAMTTEESTAMPPNQTLDQMLAQDAKGTQQLLPLQQRQDAVLKVNDLAEHVAAVHLAPRPSGIPQPAHVRILHYIVNCENSRPIESRRNATCRPSSTLWHIHNHEEGPSVFQVSEPQMFWLFGATGVHILHQL